MLRLALVAVLLTFSGQPAFAWGDDGHRITGAIATKLLTESTRARLRELFGDDDLAQIATWMDDEREALNQRLPGSARWHYENRPACARTGSATNACPKGQCITQQIQRSRAVLQSARTTQAQRSDAVRILVHLLGDLHQPLHMIDNDDRGGNDFYVRLPRQKTPRRLHEVWDTSLVRMNLRRTGVSRYATTLVTRFEGERDALQSGTVEQWASETHALALKYAYLSLPNFVCRLKIESSDAGTLPIEYVEAGRTVVEKQLAKAGMRMAIVLNETLGATDLAVDSQAIRNGPCGAVAPIGAGGCAFFRPDRRDSLSAFWSGGRPIDPPASDSAASFSVGPLRWTRNDSLPVL